MKQVYAILQIGVFHHLKGVAQKMFLRASAQTRLFNTIAIDRLYWHPKFNQWVEDLQHTRVSGSELEFYT